MNKLKDEQEAERIYLEKVRKLILSLLKVYVHTCLVKMNGVQGQMIDLMVKVS